MGTRERHSQKPALALEAKALFGASRPPGDRALEARQNEVACPTVTQSDLRDLATRSGISQDCIGVHCGRVTRLPARWRKTQ